MMIDPMIAALVREVLSEEMARIRGDKGIATTSRLPRIEQVSIASDTELQALVKRVLSIADNPAERKCLNDGDIIFRLTNQAAGPKTTASTEQQFSSGHTEQFDRGLLSERMVDQFPAHIKTVILGKQAHTTPLARDRLRQRGISIERMTS